MNNKLTCSVAMTTYKGAKYVIEQLRSIEEQTIKPDEVIICDDVSPDDTVDIIRNYIATSSLNISLHANDKNLGFWKNFEKAILLCTKDVVFLCDQDDVWMKNKVEIFLKEFEANENLVYAFSDANVIDADGNIICDSLWQNGWHIGTIDWTSLNNQDFFDAFSVRHYPPGCLVAAKRSFLQSITPFLAAHDRQIAYCAAGFGDIKAIDEKCISYRRHLNNTTPTFTNNATNKKRGIAQKILGVFHEVFLNDYEKQFVCPFYEYNVIKNTLRLIEENGSKVKTDRMKQHCEYLANLNEVKNKGFIDRLSVLRKMNKNGMYKMFRGNSKKSYLCDCLFMFVNSFKSKAKR